MVKGLNSLRRKLTVTIPKAVRRAAIEALEENAREIVAEMRRLVPVEFGNARASINWTWGRPPRGTFVIGHVGAPEDGDLRITIYAGGGDEFYAWFLEFGTVNMPANPFFFPAYRSKRTRARSRTTRKINQAIRKGAR